MRNAGSAEGRRPWRAAVAVAAPAGVMLALGLWGLDRGGMWRDEVVTFQVARRSVPQIWRLLHGVDAVHGLYYLLLHAVLAVRPGEVVLRLPSVGAAVAAAGLVAALGARLARPRVGLWAGLLYATTPLVGHYAQEGRSYALVAAGAAAATLLLVRALQGRSWWAYGVALALTCLLHELAVLLVPAHAVTLLYARVGRRAWARWGAASGAAGLVLLPLALVSSSQSGQVAWLPRPGPGSAHRLLHAFLGPGGPVFWTCLFLALVALPGPRRLTLAAVALPWAVVPPLTLLAVSQLRPMYDDRYVLYALAGAPLLVATGADRLLGAASSRTPGRLPGAAFSRTPGRLPGAASSRTPGRLPGAVSSRTPSRKARARATRRPALRVLAPLAGALAVVLAFAHHLPLHRQDRTLRARPDTPAAVSALAARELRAGDAVVFLLAIGRRAKAAYPEGFRGVRDVALAAPGPVSGTLYGRERGAAELRRRLLALDRLWVFAEPYALRSPWYPRNPVERVKLTVVTEDFVPGEPRREFVRDGVTLRLYTRRPPAPACSAALTCSPAPPPARPRPARR
ncbi:glycosyltransferase family 39 protein [Streptomyces sp. NPDC001388]|uniref:glycosyltransferase family 39 protein n=1 Tax=Streptomyces sp. NPDC001388 TaxID=3364568 RepID=UPI0036C54710